MSKEKEINVKKKLEGNCLDLSLCDLSTVPIKDILPLTKGTKLDLSCNILSSLPDDFCRLTHLVHLDLSKNHLESLPDNFGALVRLQHVDLLNNRLNLLPVSFSELDSLRWLDVGGNPLDDSLRRIAGDCLDESQCKQCARNVVSYMKSVRDEIGRREQKRLQALKEEEKRKKEGEEAERQRKKAQKLADKERRKREFEEKKAQKESEDDDLGSSEDGIKGKVEELPVTTRPASSGCCQLVCQLMTYFVIVTMLSLLGLLVLCSVYPNEQICEVCKRWTHRIVDSVTALAQSKKGSSRT